MKHILSMVGVLLLVACGQKETASTPTDSCPVAWQANYQEAVSKAKAEKKIVMVDLYTDWCGWCKRLDRDVYADSAVAAKLSSGFVSVKLNPEKSKEAAELAKKFGTRGFPHIVFVDGTGNKVAEISGYLPAAQFIQQLESVSKAK